MKLPDDPYKLCWQRPISIRTSGGVTEIEAQTYAGLAAHKSFEGGDWFEITHLPSGMSLAQGGVFPDEATAVKAMVALGYGRNNWILETEADREEFTARVLAVFAAAKAIPKPVRAQVASPLMPSDLNGFSDR